MKIEVTQQDIDKADALRARYKAKSVTFPFAQSCPIAQAIKRKQHKNAQVGRYDICVIQGNEIKYADTPTCATTFIRGWDNSEPVTPFTFEVKGFHIFALAGTLELNK